MTNERDLRLVLMISSLSAGGAERVMSTMANYWAKNGQQVTIITQSNKRPFYKLHSNIDHVSLGTSRKSTSTSEAFVGNITTILKLIRLLRSRKPVAIISFMTSMNVLAIIAGRFLNIPVIISERYNPHKFKPKKIWVFARRILYPLATYIVVQSEDARDYFLRFCDKQKIKTIYNPIGEIGMGLPSIRKRIILCIGRLEYVKGHDILISAFSKLKNKDWSLYIVGEGKERVNLEKQISQLKLEKRVFLPGACSNVADYYREAGIYVLCSRAEGFPNTLIEAMAWGLPVVSTDCKTGPSLIIKDGENGLLVPNKDVSSLTIAIDYLIESPVASIRLGNAAKSAVSIFDVDIIMNEWSGLIKKI